MKNKTLFLFILIFLTSNALASELSISPTQINFVGETNEKICQNISIKSEAPQNLIGENRWAQKGETRRKFLLHNLSSTSVGIEINQEEFLSDIKNESIKICIEGKNSGNYHGLLLYRIDGAPTGAGIWMNVSLTNENYLKEIKGKVIRGKKETSKINFAIIPSIFLIIVFLILVFKLRQKPKNKSEFQNQQTLNSYKTP